MFTRIIKIVVSGIALLSLLLPISAIGVSPDEFYKNIGVDDPIVYEKLAIYPITYPGGGERVENVLTLGEAIETGKCIVSELPEGESVNTVRVENNSKYPVVILAGQVIVGAKQDRMVSYNTVVASNSSIDLEVYCVESGRWSYKSDQFASLDVLTPNELRKKSLTGASVQGDIWSTVDEINAQTGSFSNTSALTESYSNEELQEELEKYQSEFGDLPDDDSVVGVVVFFNGKPQTADIFYSNDFLEKVWDMLLTGYSFDAILSENLGDLSTSEEIKSLISDLGSGERIEKEKDKGRYNLKTKKVDGFENQYDDEFIQMNLQFH